MVVVLELEEFAQLIDRVQRLLYPDSPLEDTHIDPEVEAGVEELLAYVTGHYELETSPELDQLFELCLDLVDDIVESRIWRRFVFARMVRVKVLTRRGAVAFYFKGDPHSGHR